MDSVTLLMALSQLCLATKDLVNENQRQVDKQEADWFRKSLTNTLQDIKEITGVSEVILTEVLEKLDNVHAQLEQKNVKESMMIDVLKSYIDNDVKQMLEGDLCDQQKWMLICMFHSGYTWKGSWIPEPQLKLDDLLDLCERKLVRNYSGQYILTRKGKESVEKGFIFTAYWSYIDLASRTETKLPISSSNLQLLLKKKRELEKVTGEPDWSVVDLESYEGDWLKFERVNGNSRRMVVKNDSLEFLKVDFKDCDS